jgi:hypothetical protein
MFTSYSRIALALGVATSVCGWTNVAIADDVCCDGPEPVLVSAPVESDAPAAVSWVFNRSTFTHDPVSGARVAQYMRKPPVEPLDDQRAVTSRYRRTRTSQRGIDGGYETSYQVQAWGNGRGGLDAEWQNFHDIWKESILSGGFYNSNYGPAFGPWGHGGNFPPNGFGGGFGWPGNWNNGFPGGPHGGWNHGKGPHHGKPKSHDRWPNDDDHFEHYQD